MERCHRVEVSIFFSPLSNRCIPVMLHLLIDIDQMEFITFYAPGRLLWASKILDYCSEIFHPLIDYPFQKREWAQTKKCLQMSVFQIVEKICRILIKSYFLQSEFKIVNFIFMLMKNCNFSKKCANTNYELRFIKFNA